MPIYEYECATCGERFEHLLRNAKDLPSKCPSCGGAKLTKVFSAFSVSSEQHSEPPAPACRSCPTGTCPYSGS